MNEWSAATKNKVKRSKSKSFMNFECGTHVINLYVIYMTIFFLLLHSGKMKTESVNRIMKTRRSRSWIRIGSSRSDETFYRTKTNGNLVKNYSGSVAFM